MPRGDAVISIRAHGERSAPLIEPKRSDHCSILFIEGACLAMGQMRFFVLEERRTIGLLQRCWSQRRRGLNLLAAGSGGNATRRAFCRDLDHFSKCGRCLGRRFNARSKDPSFFLGMME